MKILYLHGWRSRPDGTKATFLKNSGHQVVAPELDNEDFDRAVEVAQSEFDKHQPDVVVGSSRGGAIAMNIHSHDVPLVLLCPAWKNWGIAKRIKPNCVILHSRDDDVVPFADSEALIDQSELPVELLTEVGNDHRLSDESTLAVLLWFCNLLGSGQTLPPDDEGLTQTTSTKSRSEKAEFLEEATYLCDACGEEIVIPMDLTEGSSQSYVEDCPVCCRANVIHVQIGDNGSIQIWAEPEQDYT